MAEEAVARDLSDERREWAEARRHGIFATDTPKILGLSRWGTALTVWRDKCEPGEPTPMSLPAWIGLKLESTVAEMYTAAMKIRVRRDQRTLMHPTIPWLGTHLDYRAWSQPKLLVECKTRAYMRGYGPDGSTEIPADVWAQVQHEMLVTGADECHIAVLFGHTAFRVYPIKRDDAFLEKLVPKLETYWFTHIVPGIPPLPTGHDLDSEEVKRTNRDHDASMKAATPEQEALIGRYAAARLNVAQATLVQSEYENRIKQWIGESAGLEGSFGKITWKKSKDGESIDWEMVAVTQGNVIEELFTLARPADEDLARYARAQAVANNAVSLATVKKPGSRRFLVDFAEEG